MSRIRGDEPRWWHAPSGAHQMPDPRKHELHERYWDKDDRAYAEHLREHERLADRPERQEGDPAPVQALFDHIESLQKVIDKERQLITALRLKAAQGAETDERES